MNTSKRVIINTLAQYLRTVLNIILSFYSVRLILNILGAEDYGIYTLIAGITSMLSFITQALVSTTQRFMSFYQGKNDVENMKAFFSNSMLLHICISIILGLILVSLTPLLFNGFLNVPHDRIYSAKIVYYIVIIILLVTFCTAPFRALLVSHENIVYTSIIDVLDGVLKVILVLLLQFVCFDKLIFYGFIMLGIHFVNLLLLASYAYSKYDECITPKFKYFSLSYIKDLFSFAIWTIYGTGCIVIRTQGLAIIVNRFLSTIANAAYGIGLQVSGAVSTISVALLNAMRPQIVKSEGQGDHDRALKLSVTLCKFSLFLLSALCIPCIFEMPSLLSIWLKDVPEYTVLFARMALLATLADTLTLGLNVYCEAIGKIKVYNLVIFTLKLCTLPLAIGLLICGIGPISIAIAYIGTELVTAIIRIPFLNKLGGLNSIIFLKDVIGKSIIPILSCIIVGYLITRNITINFRFIITFISTISTCALTVWLCGLSENEKSLLKRFFKN